MPMRGGVARDGWHGLGLGRKKLLRDGIAATAVVKSFYEMDDASTFGNAQHDFTLEVRVEGREPYEVQGLFKIPAKLVGTVGPGEVVPVRVHPSEPARVAIDWDGWEPSGTGGAGIEIDESLAGLNMDDVREQVRSAMTTDARKMMIDGWVMARKSGQLSDSQLEQALSGALQSGLLTDEEADQVRRAGG